MKKFRLISLVGLWEALEGHGNSKKDLLSTATYYLLFNDIIKGQSFKIVLIHKEE